jgi:A/G-specific adenine glycosylase
MCSDDLLAAWSASERATLERCIAGLHRWFRDNQRDLLWRRTRDPYAIWVSEVMLQQTQVVTVTPYFQRWMERFPTVQALADADERDVLLLWEGLGYYSRARNLHRAARIVRDELGAVVPRDEQRFRSLPGVGAYTAAAVLSIAFDLDLAVLDGNVKRVLARLLSYDEDISTPKAYRVLQKAADQLLPAHTAAVHNQAVMELGALVCKPKDPSCERCALAESCLAYRDGTTTALPRPKKKRVIPTKRLAVAVVRHEGALLIYQRPYGGMLAGLWDFPQVELNGQQTPQTALIAHLAQRYGVSVGGGTVMPLVKHAYTHLRVALEPVLFESRAPQNGGSRAAELSDEPSRSRPRGKVLAGEVLRARWVSTKELATHALPRASHKVLDVLGELDEPVVNPRRAR